MQRLTGVEYFEEEQKRHKQKLSEVHADFWDWRWTPSLARGARQGRRRRRRQGGPAQIEEIRTDFRKFMVMAFFF